MITIELERWEFDAIRLAVRMNVQQWEDYRFRQQYDAKERERVEVTLHHARKVLLMLDTKALEVGDAV